MTIAAIQSPACRRRLSLSRFAVSASRPAILCCWHCKPVSYLPGAFQILLRINRLPGKSRPAREPGPGRRKARCQFQDSRKFCLNSLVLVTAGKNGFQRMKSAGCRFQARQVGATKTPKSRNSVCIGLIPASSGNSSGSALVNFNLSESCCTKFLGCNRSRHQR